MSGVATDTPVARKTTGPSPPWRRPGALLIGVGMPVVEAAALAALGRRDARSRGRRVSTYASCCPAPS